MARDPSTAVSFGMLEDVLGFRMQRLRAAIAKPLIAGMKRWGLRRGAFMVLALVAENPGLSQTVLVRETGIRKSLLVALLHELEERGLVQRRERASDRRHNQLFITDAGRTVLGEMAAMVAEIEAPIHAALSDASIGQMKKTMDEALAALAAGGAKDPPA